MKLRADYDKTELVHFAHTTWAPSPEPAVMRKLLEREGGEVARATSIVRYGPKSAFPAHVHDEGEEFLVLDGIFSDEHASYPAGTYVRNPPGSRHRPFSREGCTIFVKLRQFARGDGARVVVAPDDGWSVDANVATQELHRFGEEHVILLRIAAGGRVVLPKDGRGAELLVVSGSIELESATCPRWTWRRTAASSIEVSSSSGAVVWLKRGHLSS